MILGILIVPGPCTLHCIAIYFYAELVKDKANASRKLIFPLMLANGPRWGIAKDLPRPTHSFHNEVEADLAQKADNGSSLLLQQNLSVDKVSGTLQGLHLLGTICVRSSII